MTRAETEARIRDAALTLFARQGFPDTTVRQIAIEAGVSPGLVIHYYESKGNLRAACDRRVADLIRLGKQNAAAQGRGFDVLAALREAEQAPPVVAYLARALAERSPGVRELVDQLVHDAVGYTEAMVAAEMMRPSADPYGRAVILTVWSLGAVVLHEHVERLLGIDLLADAPDPRTFARYAGPVVEILADGVLTPQVAQAFRDGVAEWEGREKDRHE